MHRIEIIHRQKIQVYASHRINNIQYNIQVYASHRIEIMGRKKIQVYASHRIEIIHTRIVIVVCWLVAPASHP
jgi:hypothetical protein